MSKTKTTGSLKRVFTQYVLNYKGKMCLASFFLITLSIATWGYTYSLKPLFDDVLGSKNEDLLYKAPLIFLLMACLKSISVYVSRISMETVSQNVISDMQKDLYNSLIYKKQSFFADNVAVSLTNRFTFDLAKMREQLANIISISSRNVALLIGYLINLFYLNWKLALFALIVLPLAVAPIGIFTKYLRRYANKIQEKTGILAEVLNETFSLIKQIKVYSMEQSKKQRAEDAIDLTLRYTIKSIRVRILAIPVVEVLGAASFCLVFIAGGKLVIDGSLTQGEFVSFITSLLLIFQPIKGLTNLNSYIQDSAVSSARTFELIDRDDSMIEGKKELDKPFNKQIEFKNIDFSYSDGTRALRNINLTIKKGERVAFVGLSGSGKTTILNLIPRLFDVTKGKFLIDGVDVKDLTLKSLRSQMAIVSQESGLFNTSIMENVRFGKTDASDESVIKACKAAQADGFILEQENGYDSIVGDAGVKLSGGQKQRISIARAILKDAPILLLDEATSALDSKVESKIQKTLETLMQNRTSITVAHRLSTVVNSNRIYVFKGGEIVEQGTHKDLMALNGEYSTLYNLQHNNAS
ncbi:MAG: ABC transporter ATP-binding protein [Proteobacteria bacterium]|nr:ABC transporter ATP-binding protein [Pseudomonadota bacterium]